MTRWPAGRPPRARRQSPAARGEGGVRRSAWRERRGHCVSRHFGNGAEAEQQAQPRRVGSMLRRGTRQSVGAAPGPVLRVMGQCVWSWAARVEPRPPPWGFRRSIRPPRAATPRAPRRSGVRSGRERTAAPGPRQAPPGGAPGTVSARLPQRRVGSPEGVFRCRLTSVDGQIELVLGLRVCERIENSGKRQSYLVVSKDHFSELMRGFGVFSQPLSCAIAPQSGSGPPPRPAVCARGIGTQFMDQPRGS